MLDIKSNQDGNRYEFALAGRLDTATAPSLESELRAIFPVAQELILDFSELEYISSAGLRVLLLSQKELGKKGSLIIRSVNDTIMEIFEMTGFSDLLTIE